MYYQPSESKTYKNHSEIRRAFKNVSFPSSMSDDLLAGFGVYPVTTISADLGDYEVEVKSTEVVEVNGSYVINHKKRAMTPEEVAEKKKLIIQSYETAIAAHLDGVVRTKGYDSVISASSYAGSANPFQAEGQAVIEWRGAVWAAAYAILQEVEAGNRPMPEPEELIVELPQITWPS